jgi:hypothetical protein
MFQPVFPTAWEVLRNSQSMRTHECREIEERGREKKEKGAKVEVREESLLATGGASEGVPWIRGASAAGEAGPAE